MNGTHAFATTEVVAQRRASPTDSTADRAEPSAGGDDGNSHTGFAADFGVGVDDDEPRRKPGEPGTAEGER